MTDAPNKPGFWTNFRVPASAVRFDTENEAEKVVKILNTKEIYWSEISIKEVNPYKFFEDMKEWEMIWVPNFDSRIMYYLPKWHGLINQTLRWDNWIEDDQCIKVTWFFALESISSWKPVMCVYTWRTVIYASTILADWMPHMLRS